MDAETTAARHWARTRNATSRNWRRFEAMELLLARCYYALEATGGRGTHPSLIEDIHILISGKKASCRNHRYNEDLTP